MREIKFRGWDVGFKEMESWESLLTSDVLPEVLQGLFSNLKLMQYTGLKDKNGIEIYEGDIINCHIVTPKKNWKELKKVDYDEDMARFAAVSLDGNHWSSLPSNVAFNLNPVRIDKCEIIGNIYENPELLKEEPTC